MTNETTTLLKAPDDGESSENVVDPSYTLASMDEPDEPPETQTVDKLVADYILLRDELKIMQQEHAAAEENVKEALARISMRIREIADVQKVDSFAIRGVGTAFRVIKESYRATDWESFINWCKATDNFHCIERRPAKLAVKAIHKEGGVIPPGLDYVAEQEFQVRKATK